jgi:DNA polymerase III subunit epsilon
MNDFSNFGFEETAVIDKYSEIPSNQWRLLRRLYIPDRFNKPRGGSTKRGLVIDVESTGLSLENDDVIQLAMLPFDYEVDTGRITEVHNDLAFESLREPSLPISEEASIITGITDDMVSGHIINEVDVTQLVSQSDLIIAHNARFDRPMVERIWSCFADKPWSCTFTSIDWLREGFSAGKLDYIGAQFGWFYDGHRALADCEACLALLAQILPGSNRRVLELVRDAAHQSDYLIRAVGAPFEEKDTLKDRGYRWRPAELPHGKVWWTVSTDPEAEIEWLKSEVYRFEKAIPVHQISSLSRFSDRVWEFTE